MLGLRETVYPRRRSRAVGTRFVQRVSKGRRIVEYEGEITAYEKPTRYAVRMGRGQVAFDVEWGLTDTGGATRLEYTARSPGEAGMARPAEAIFRYLSTRVARKQMKRLKKAAEEAG
jgi:hypothetical protein